ncbi:MAG: small ribosomal subunit biogenesis GTPase RsgA [Acaryochloridaceae cyanobacterium RU_4_10]|nr:small ribosomal subunit biogenesis GTPase RsgA [Acaryochloridaceae cyanobacterium RU_4_10]
MTISNSIQTWVGTVLAVQANFYRVRLDPPQAGEGLEQSELLCTRRARLKKLGQQVMVGDRAIVEEPDWMGQRGAIAEVLPRQSELERPPIANADQVLLVFAMADPVIDVYQLSRFLVAIESTGLKIIPCLSKADLVTARERREWCDRLQQWGYSAIAISVQTGVGLERLRHQLERRITVLAGPSGVGKSSLINAFAPHLDLRVGEISDHWRKGKHTTRHVELFELPQGGLLADTPGFSQPTLSYLPEDLIHAFPEGRERLASHNCQFKDCLHKDEPNCAVRDSWERYGDYLEFLEEAIAYQTQLRRSRNPESRLKLQSQQNGTSTYEPKLETKRYRRTSRRTQQQSLNHLYDEAQE